MKAMELASSEKGHRVVIVGGGFGGLYAAKSLKKAPVQVTVLDKRNFHLFQPLLYQVATGSLSPGEIASPLRAVLSRHQNTRVMVAEVTDIDPDRRRVLLRHGSDIQYDTVIVATGSSHHYFGHEEWASCAPGLKTVEDALEIRRRILSAFEKAELETDPQERQSLMTFILIGGGPTGVELAGALAELARQTLAKDFRQFDPRDVQIFLLEGTDRILPTYPPDLSEKAKRQLERLKVTVLTEALVTHIQGNRVSLRHRDEIKTMTASTLLWAAGVLVSPLGKKIAERTGVPMDPIGRLMVAPDLSIPEHPHIFIIGDLAHLDENNGKPLAGVAPVAMQEGRYVAEVIVRRLAGESCPPFHYRNKGSLAVIGRNAAVADLGFLKLSGFPAWILWVFVHIWYLIEFDNKLVVLIQWAWNYFTRKRGIRLITDS